MFKKLNDGSYEVTSKSKAGNTWIVSSDLKSCNCPKFKFILKEQGKCHHIVEVSEIERTSETMDKTSLFHATFAPDQYKDLMTEDEFAKVYGEEQLQYLKRIGEIFVMKDKVRLLK